MGDIPAKTSMVSSIITYPTTGGQAIASDTTFNITVQTQNLAAGSFTNADATYYAAPQFLDGGIIVGHTHVTVQDLGSSLNPTAALDATQFAFFKGINDAGNGKGLLTATVTGGLPAGNYRVCTMASASNHQPVLMPVAQRGTSDDCTKFVVSGSGTTINTAANDGSGGIAAAGLAASAVAAGPDVVDTALSSAATESASSAAAGKGGKATSSAASEASTTSAAGKGGKAISSAASEASTTSAAAGKASATSGAGKAQATGAGGAAGKGGAGGAAGGKGGFGGKGGRKQRRQREFIA
jgi:hypothetical protein